MWECSAAVSSGGGGDRAGDVLGVLLSWGLERQLYGGSVGDLICINAPLTKNTLPFVSTPRSEKLFLDVYVFILSLLLSFTFIWFGLKTC